MAETKWRAASRGLAFLLLVAGAFPPLAEATTVTVPDDAPSIQTAIDSWADEVLVRPGLYPETITIDHVMTLRGLVDPGSSDPPVLLGLVLDDTRQGSSHSAYLEISDLHFQGQVRNVFHLAQFSGEYHLEFTHCVMDSGVTDQTATKVGQVIWSIVGCTIAGGVAVTKPFAVTLQNNAIRGPVRAAASAYHPEVSGNTIEGPGPCGIWAASGEDDITIHDNTVRGFDVGMQLVQRGTDVQDNLVEYCSGAGIVIDDYNAWGHTVVGNTVRSCGSAITVDHGDWIRLYGNVAEDCGAGIVARFDYSADVGGNRVSRCAGGLTINWTGYPTSSTVASRRNVVESCSGGIDLLSSGPCFADGDTVVDSWAGIRLQSTDLAAAIDSALVLSCRGSGIEVDGPRVSATRCVVGRSGSDGIRLTAASGVMLAGNTSFLDGGSGFVVQAQSAANDTVVANIGFGNTRHGLAIDPGAAVVLSCNDWFGNASGAASGASPGPSDLAVNPIFCDLAANDARLAASSPLADAPGCGLIGALGVGCNAGTAAVTETAPDAFTLTGVGPVPTRGAVAFELTLPRPAVIEVTVHDVQGRRVAFLAGGEWGAGRHPLEWNGEGAGGRVPPGLYLIRYRYPGGETSRRVVIAQ